MDEPENVTSLTPYLAKKNRGRITAVPAKEPPAYYVIINRLSLLGEEKGRFQIQVEVHTGKGVPLNKILWADYPEDIEFILSLLCRENGPRVEIHNHARLPLQHLKGEGVEFFDM